MAELSDEKADDVIVPAWDRVSWVFLYLHTEMINKDKQFFKKNKTYHLSHILIL